MRDYWNNVETPDEEKLVAEVIALIKKAGKLSYSEMQELRKRTFRISDRSSRC